MISVFPCICQQLKLHQVKKAGKESDCPQFQSSITPFSGLLVNRMVFLLQGLFFIIRSTENRRTVSLRKVQ